MFKNERAALCGLLLLAGCARAEASVPEAFQGVVELDDAVFGFDVGGRVEHVDVVEEQTIEAGAPLASLDPTMAKLARDARKAEVAAAEAQLALLKAGVRAEDVRATRAELEAARARETIASGVLARQESLVQSGVVGAASLDEPRAQLAQITGSRRMLEQKLGAQQKGARVQEIAAAEARVDAARSALAAEEERVRRHHLFAPRGGTVLDVHVETGELAGVGSPVVTLADTAHPYVDIFVPQGRIGEIVTGAPMSVRVDTEKEPFRGHVEHVSRTTEFTPRFLFSERERPNLVVRVRVRIEGGERRVFAGVPAFVTVGSEP